MVSNARDDLPEPERPVITVSVLRGISRLMFFRLCWRAPRIDIFLTAMVEELSGPPLRRGTRPTRGRATQRAKSAHRKLFKLTRGGSRVKPRAKGSTKS